MDIRQHQRQPMSRSTTRGAQVLDGNRSLVPLVKLENENACEPRYDASECNEQSRVNVLQHVQQPISAMCGDYESLRRARAKVSETRFPIASVSIKNPS